MLGDEVTVGHSVTLHGCTIESHVPDRDALHHFEWRGDWDGQHHRGRDVDYGAHVIPPGSLGDGLAGQSEARTVAGGYRDDCDVCHALCRIQRNLSRRSDRAGRERRLEQLQRLSRLAGTFPMAEKRKFQAIKGTRDLLPPETELWNRVEQTAREVFGTYGFGEIRPADF